MKIFKNTKTSHLRKTVTALVLGAALATSGALPAHAYDRDWHRHEVVAHRYWHPPHPVVVQEAPAVYAPPVVYSAPPPVESSGFNLILPLHIH